MKIIPKPFKTHQKEPAIKAIVTAPVPRSAVTALAYEQLVTSQNLHPDTAKALLGLPQK